MNEKAIIRLVRSATLKINYAGHTILIDPVFADKGTLQSALGVYKNPRVHLVMPISDITEGVDMVLLTHNHIETICQGQALALDVMGEYVVFLKTEIKERKENE